MTFQILLDQTTSDRQVATAAALVLRFGDIYLDTIRVVKQALGNQCFLPIVLEEWRFFHVGMQD